ncbi:DUF3616 domain-containing protein [Merismopedia glauca]|uniref:DUF3616 domain-containing protein n=1 Tax=Merismopedia glauca CCAP 1448/3 TaxID=1296344 RepID=A0A2T1BZC1_9CYAN|nr:DUF3616 domain-containing protein [Merismopedia glauca]PSB01223.1 DUF3616 domain-containing protein [Merismopedia glauca CCAP 1448/3]
MTIASLLYQVLLQFPPELGEHRDDLSAVMLTTNTNDSSESQFSLWLGSDETSTIERLSLIDNRTFGNHHTFKISDFINLPEPDDQEIDIEGLDYDETEHYLWLVGSHSWKRKKPKDDKNEAKNLERLATLTTERNRYILARIPLVNGELFQEYKFEDVNLKSIHAAKLALTKTENVLIESLKSDPHLKIFVSSKVPGKDNGFDIEGIAVKQGKIFLGLRGPVIRGWAIILEIELEETTTDTLNLKSIGEEDSLYKKHFVYLNGLGIRDLCFEGEDLLILAGATMDLDAKVKVFRLSNAVNLPDNILHKPEVITDLPHGEGEDKPEGVTLFQALSGEPSLLVVYDSPNSARLQGESNVLADVFKL